MMQPPNILSLFPLSTNHYLKGEIRFIYPLVAIWLYIPLNPTEGTGLVFETMFKKWSVQPESSRRPDFFFRRPRNGTGSSWTCARVVVVFSVFVFLRVPLFKVERRTIKKQPV